MRYILSLLTCFVCFSLIAQNNTNNIWMYGDDRNEDQSILGFYFDFNEDPVELKEQQLSHGFWRQNSSISDDQGNLLFYTNGYAVVDRNYEVMPNGDDLNSGLWKENYVNGDDTEGAPFVGASLILQDPGYCDGYYILHTQIVYEPVTKGDLILNISYVDMKLNEGYGDVVYKNQKYFEGGLMVGYLTAIKHDNEKDWWIMNPYVGETILTFAIDEEGVGDYFFQNADYPFNRDSTSASGGASLSPDGTKYALYSPFDGLGIYDFDRSNGMLTQQERFFENDTLPRYTFSDVDWSPNSKYIYLTVQNDLYQVDVEENDHDKKVVHIDTYDGTLNPFWTTFVFGALAPDGKIYITPGSSSHSFHIIHEPDKKGKACNFVQNDLELPSILTAIGQVPNFPRYVDGETWVCDSTTAVSDYKMYDGFDFYPNPAVISSTLSIDQPYDNLQYIIYDLNGRKIRSEKITTYTKEIVLQTKDLHSGVYNVTLVLRKGTRIFQGHKKLIVIK